MRKNSLARVAAFAAAALVGGLVPTLGVASASAAEPTALSVSPSSSIVASTGGNVDFTVTLNSGTAANGVDYYVTSGPDASVPASLLGTPCDMVDTTTYTCSVAHGTTAGVDNVRFFSDAANTGSFQNGDVFTSGTLTVAGAVNRVALTPTVGHAAEFGFQQYTVSAFDAANTPVPGATVRVTAVDPAVSPGIVAVTHTDPGTARFGGIAFSPDDAVTSTNVADIGIATVWVASSKAGTVNVTANATGGDNGGATKPLINASGTLVVSAGGANAITAVAVTPSPQNAFTSTTVSETITLTNASGDAVSGVTPDVAVVTGPNTGAALTGVAATNGLGQVTVTYPAGTTVGTDNVRAFVQQTTAGNTGGLDPSEPRDIGVVNLATNVVTGITGVNSNAPVDVNNVPLTFTVATSVASKSGINVTFALPVGHPAKYSVNANGTTDATGKVVATVTNSNPLDGDSIVVTASAAGHTATATASWEARVADSVVIAPAANTKAVGGTTTHTVTATDQFGTPVSGLTYQWSLDPLGRNNSSNNPDATGTGSSFTYTDTGVSTTPGEDVVRVSATNAAGTITYGSASANQFWVLGSAQASQANIDINHFNGFYDNTGVNGPYVPTNFTKSDTAGVSSNPSVAVPSVTPEQVSVAVINANGDPLYGKSISFTSTGVGVFTDSSGNPIGTSTTALVSDGSFGEQMGFATVYVRSTTAGTQTIHATVDGITDTGTITYTGQYVPVTPQRVADTRTGQGDISTWNSSNPPVGGRLAPNTLYYFDYQNVDMPRNGDAYAFNVTAIQPNGAGNLRLETACESNNNIPATSLINYQPGKDVANFVIVPNDCSLKIYSAGSSAAVAIDFMGYYPNNDQAAIHSITATRVVDTRTGLGGGTGRVTGGTSRSFQITGNAGIPAGATAVALNVTAIQPSGQGNLRVYPNGATTPNASNINYIPGVDKAAFVIVKLPANGKIDVYSAGGTVDVAIDAFAYYTATSTMVSAAPVRILDTRNGGTLAADTAKAFQVTGLAGVPADAQAVLVSVTGIHNSRSTGVGNLRLYPTGGAVPLVSTLNYVSKTSDVANFSIVKLGTGGKLSLYSAGSPIDVAVDVVGYIPAA